MFGRKKEEKKSYLDDPTPRPSFYETIATKINDLPQGLKKAVWIAIGCAITAVIVAAIAFSVWQVYGQGEEDNAITNVQAPIIGSEPSQETSDTQTWDNHIFGIESWTFLSGEETINTVKANLFNTLTEKGMSAGSFVYILESWESAPEGYVGYLRTSPEDTYYKVLITPPTFVPELTEVDVASVPGPAAPEGFEDPSKAQTQQEQNAPQTQDTDTPDTPQVPETQDTRDLSSGIALSNTQGIASLLPSDAASLVQQSLIEGTEQAYGFKTNPDLSKIYPDSVTINGQNCTFEIMCMDENRNTLLLAVEFDQKTGQFGAERIQE